MRGLGLNGWLKRFRGRKNREVKLGIAEGVRDFIMSLADPEGGFRASNILGYYGISDSQFSDIAPACYAAIIAKTLGFKLPHPLETVRYIQQRQRPDGRFASLDPRPGLTRESRPFTRDSIAIYETTIAVMGLRALGHKPIINPAPFLHDWVRRGRLRGLPGYALDFFPACFTALDQPIPEEIDRAVRELEDEKQDNHIVFMFHLVHHRRLLGERPPREDATVKRVLSEQCRDGGWHRGDPRSMVHATFDAVFILRQLRPNDPKCIKAIQRAADWTLRNRNPDGGFGNFPGHPSDADATYFQLGTLVMAGRVREAEGLNDDLVLGWGHCIRPLP